MVPVQLKGLSKVILVPVILLVLVFGFMCIGTFHGEKMHEATTPYAIGASPVLSTSVDQVCCDAGISSYVSLWRNASLTILSNVRTDLLLFALGFMFVIGAWRTRHSIVARRSGTLYELYIRQHPDLLTFDTLKPAFARGILHSKAY